MYRYIERYVDCWIDSVYNEVGLFSAAGRMPNCLRPLTVEQQMGSAVVFAVGCVHMLLSCHYVTASRSVDLISLWKYYLVLSALSQTQLVTAFLWLATVGEECSGR